MNIKKTTVFRIIDPQTHIPVQMEEWSSDHRTRELMEYDLNQDVVRHFITNFDDKGRLIYQEEKFPKENINTVFKTEYQDAGLIKINREFFLDGSNNKTVVRGNSPGNALSVEKFEDENSEQPYEIQTFEYHGDGRILGTSKMDAEKNIIETEVWNYDENLRLKTYESLSESGNNTLQITYDEKERIIGKTGLLNGEKQEETIMEYDDMNGTMTETIHNNYGESIKKFNAQGLMIYHDRKLFYTRKNIKTIQTTLEYNPEGFLTTETTLDNTDSSNCYRNEYEYEFYE